MNVVYVENDSNALLYFCEAIHKIDPTINCITASTGKEATLKLLDTDLAPDYIFLGHKLSDVQTKVLITFIKRHNTLKDAVVVVYGDHDNKKRIHLNEDLGADFYLQKQNDFKQYCHSLSLVLRA